MKKTISVFILLPLCILSCNNPSVKSVPEIKSHIYIFFASPVENDRIGLKFSFAGDKIFDGLITSDNSTSPIYEIEKSLPKGKYTIDIQTYSNHRFINLSKPIMVDTEKFISLSLSNFSDSLHPIDSLPRIEMKISNKGFVFM